ncbi:hypothetical protein BDV95DRAFT_626601 [Massariosphaeria phaeospora]|uniref:NADPH-dependent diflavin oxidoreductase 1 n=1 Tax=Massariosphaeria phaeospora TaxID=100035 RepID=A0A7C8MCF2_9PLEO|nr:hypothetical protein BDV95DRAFT_626601 [Massariosphaeria phaeospora]
MAALQERRALVLYGSETGNAQDVAEEMGRIAERLRFDTQVTELNAITLRQLLQPSVVLISISTTGQGELPANCQTFWKALRSTRLRSPCLQQVRFASFGLGDTSYPKFNWAHRKLYNRLIQLGAQPICDRGESDEQHPEGIDGSFLPWSTTVRQRLIEEYPLPEGLLPIPDNVLLDPKWLLERCNSETSPATHIKDIGSPTIDGDGEKLPPADLLDIAGGLTAEVVSNARLTPQSHWQDVRHLILNVSEHHSYLPGDVLTIHPKNFPTDVTQFLHIMDWDSIADTPLRFTAPSSPTDSSTKPLPIPNISPSTPLTLRILLTNHLDIMSIPRRSFFAQLAHFTTDQFHRERLLEFTNPEYIDELYDYTTRPRRSILEVLQEFESLKLPWQRICSIVPVIRGRQFSIASALSPSSLSGDAQTRIELLIAIVKYRTVIKRIRQGVCTRYVAELQPGRQITVTLQRASLGATRADVGRPVVMIGPGTGVAPMRALIYQRKYWRDEESPHVSGDAPRDVLFFGCRNAESDFFFKDEWQKLKGEDEPLDVFAAFSRDQRRKVYVQDLVRGHSARVYDALANKDGLVYICGSSGKMPQAVREALIEVFQSHSGRTREEAEAYLVDMEKKGRYKQETW